MYNFAPKRIGDTKVPYFYRKKIYGFSRSNQAAGGGQSGAVEIFMPKETEEPGPETEYPEETGMTEGPAPEPTPSPR